MRIPVIVLLLVAAEIRADSPVREFRDKMIGRWEVTSTQIDGESVLNPTKIETVVIDKDSIMLEDAMGGRRHLEYQILQSESGWAIDLYRKGGKADGRLYPSLIQRRNGRLQILLPLNSKAANRRPRSLDTSIHQDWILLKLQPAEASLSSTAQPVDAENRSDR